MGLHHNRLQSEPGRQLVTFPIQNVNTYSDLSLYLEAFKLKGQRKD